MLYPLKFEPILVERVWGGTTLTRYGKPVPAGKRIGESWEISDRPGAESRVANGPYKGQTLRELIQTLGPDAVIGRARPPGTPRFPLLIKLLDARETLSVQVHPPAAIAGQLGGEPKTEMWYILETAGDAQLIAGLRRGVTRSQFEEALASGTLADLVHRLPVHPGDAIFIPSGRIHALGAGLVLVEIQQNSDTTYRVFDWGRPRELHVKQSLASIDFDDFEPASTPLPVTCEHFITEKLMLAREQSGRCDGSTFHVLCCIAGKIGIGGEVLNGGEFALLPAGLGDYTLKPLTNGAAVLRTFLPKK